ncbi:Anti-sigma factor antagonist [Pseudodesulfovibrio profundus]|uniref:Anti-sigma factor antagonist n=1 Tax=Pseudodesulfovibrio profundus TaxID=57320 RepID=A0A2C8F868_9BACT|nr:STAS domain-containing protein [Pseudodesulfovibrio profundus]MBC17334.1 anti-anti-sigma factor [Desulfovibrio sp.]SOB58605.1 Anti-sigma factor antagonist [Pseudodesulfovibrio profundus]|tara:strand:+ start:486 stop:818 length:333 start_codon:yes stop_codon:yes gene_type:complete
MALNETKENGITIITVNGNLDAEGTQDMEERVIGLLENGERSLLFDFSDLDYINSSGLRVLVLAYQRLKKNQGSVAICGIKDYIQEVFEVSGYDKIFPLYPNRTDAISGM